eukprot:1793676-Pleurochrysis_carterae.AAC.1
MCVRKHPVVHLDLRLERGGLVRKMPAVPARTRRAHRHGHDASAAALHSNALSVPSQESSRAKAVEELRLD